jgi:hypothetical protein
MNMIMNLTMNMNMNMAMNTKSILEIILLRSRISLISDENVYSRFPIYFFQSRH